MQSRLLELLILCSLILIVGTPAAAQFNATERVSVSSAALQGTGASTDSAASGEGRYVVFVSTAANLITGDTNGAADLFLFDRQTDAITRISVSSSGLQSNGASNSPVISDDGRFTAYVSSADNLVTGDTNDTADIFVFDKQTAETTRVSISSAAIQADEVSSSPAISDDGRYVAFASASTVLVAGDTNGVSDVFLHDRQAGTTERLSVGLSAAQSDGASTQVSMSGDGRYVVFTSSATNLVAGDTNGVSDVFVYDRTGLTMTRVSVADTSLSSVQSDGASSDGSISRDGAVIGFTSAATNLVAGDTNTALDLFTYQRSSGAVARVNISSDEVQSNGGTPSRAAFSETGRYIVFDSEATDLATGDTNNRRDLFVRDATAGTTTRISREPDNDQLTSGDSVDGSLSDSGQFGIYTSAATSIVVGDTNAVNDIFVTNLECLLGITVTPATDSDSDGTGDCSDACALDAAKTAAGVCGCGVADTDTDGDSSFDCNDGCTEDAGKTAAGVCGCGTADTDANANGVADCLDPSADTVPRTPRVRINGSNFKVTIPADFAGVTYNVRLIRDGRTITRKTTTRTVVYFKNLSRGKYRVRYTVTLDAVTTQSSAARKVTL